MFKADAGPGASKRRSRPRRGLRHARCFQRAQPCAPDGGVMGDLLVRARQLTVKFAQGHGFVHAVNGVDFDLNRREVLCILGESGSGKSVTLRALMRLNPPSKTIMSGTLSVGGHDVVAASEREMSSLRGPFVSMIFQDPMTSLDPVFTIGQQITEAITRHAHVSGSEARKRALNLLELVQIPSPGRRLDAYPHELSGGLRQRAMIAIALSCKPKLLLADEPHWTRRCRYKSCFYCARSNRSSAWA